MDHHHSGVESVHHSLSPEDDHQMAALAANAAAQAFNEAEQASVDNLVHVAGPDDDEDEEEDETILTPSVCRICGQGNEEGRPILRFLPVDHDLAAANAAPSVITFTDDIALHIFCGKTASILPTVNRPDLEILTKAGLKNKHGIGPEVNAALARTRCAILAQEGAKEKHFYLVREFEAHLAAIRNTHISFPPEVSDPFDIPGMDQSSSYESTPTLEHPGAAALELKVLPVKAAAGITSKAGRRPLPNDYIPYGGEVGTDGKIRCPCGGTHLPTGTARGAQSWRSHIMTKRHQKWMEEQGMLGAV